MVFQSVTCRRYEDGAWKDFEDQVAPESTITLRWPGMEPILLSGYAMDMEPLVLGDALLHLCAVDEEPSIISREENDFTLTPRPLTKRQARHWTGTLSPSVVLQGMSQLLDSPGFWWETGCFHRAGLWDPEAGEFLVRVEDIPRHNCIDRLAGWGLLQRRSLGDLVLFISARVTASLMNKAARLGPKVICTRAAPTSMGLAMAQEQDISVAAYVKPNRFTIFHDPQGRFEGGASHG